MKIEELIKQLDAESFNQTPEGWRPIRHAKYELESVKAALDKSGTAIGNEHETYSLAKRVENLTQELNHHVAKNALLTPEVQRAQDKCRELQGEIDTLKYLDDEASHGASDMTNKVREINALANRLWGWANMMPEAHIRQLSKIIDLSGGVTKPANSDLSHAAVANQKPQ